MVAEGRKVAQRRWNLCPYLRQWKRKKWAPRFSMEIHKQMRKDAGVDVPRLYRTFDDIKQADQVLYKRGVNLQTRLDLHLTIDWLSEVA
jgi:hypothetical protein